MTEDKISKDVFVSCIRKLIIHCEHLIREADSVQTIQESLVRLEEIDSNFYRYELVKLLQSQLEDKLGKIVDENIEQYPANRADLNHAEMIDSITSKLMCSTEYTKLLKKLKNIVSNATEILINRYDVEIENTLNTSLMKPNGSKQYINNFKQSQREAQAIFNDNNLFSIQSTDIESSTSSFFNPESCIFLNQNELIALAEDLDCKKRNFSKRQAALEKLLRLPVIEIHCWDVLEPGLIGVLNEPELHSKAIKFIAKGFMSTPSNIKALYSILVKQLVNQFNSKMSQLVTLKSGVDTRKPEVKRIIVSIRLMNEFQQNVVYFWVRYSEKFIEDIIECTLKLLAIPFYINSLDSGVSPIHFLSIIDPRVEWLIKWTHGTYSRNPMVKYLRKYSKIVEEAVKSCLKYFRITHSNSNNRNDVNERYLGSDQSSFIYTSAHLDYLYFCHSLSLIMRLIQYKGFWKLLEEVMEKEDHTIQTFTIGMITFWFKQTQIFGSSDNCLDVNAMCFGMIKSLIRDENSCINCFCNSKFLVEVFRVFNPLKKLKGEDLKLYLNKNDTSLSQFAECISELIQFPKMKVLFLKNPNTIVMSQSAVQLFSDIIEINNSSNDDRLVSSGVLSNLVHIVCQFFSGSVDLHSIWTEKVHCHLIRAWKQATENYDRCPTPTKDNSNDEIFETMSWKESLIDDLYFLLKTSRGAFYLAENGVLMPCIMALLDKIRLNNFEASYTATTGNIDLLISHAIVVANLSGISMLLQHSFTIQSCLSHIWTTTECDPDDLPQYQGRIWPVNGIDSSSVKPLVRLIGFHASFTAFYVLIKDKKLPNESFYSLRDSPKSLVSFVDRLVIVNSIEKIHGLFNYESSHLLGLHWLVSTITNLNCLLLLQSQYHFIEALIEAQKNNLLPTNNGVVVDALSIERYYIIVKSLQIAGPNEQIPIRRMASYTEQELMDITICPDPRKMTIFCAHSEPAQHKSSESLSELLRQLKKSDQFNIDNHQEYLMDVLTNKTFTNRDLLNLCQLIHLYSSSFELAEGAKGVEKFNKDDLRNSKSLAPFFKLGIKMMIEYGENLQILKSKEREKSVESLTTVLNYIKMRVLSVEKIENSDSIDCYGFDWFGSCLWLMCTGDVDKCFELIDSILQLDYLRFVWPWISNVDKSKPQQCHVCYWVECIVATEFPAVYSSFVMCGYPLGSACSHWLSQVLLGILDWPSIVKFIFLSLFYSKGTFPIYFCVALLRLLQSSIKARLHQNDLILFIREATIYGLDWKELLEEINGYKLKYDDKIIQDFQSCQ